MLEIEYRGGNSVVISTKERSLVIDPKVDFLGIANPKTVDIELCTEARFAIVPKADDTVVIEGPGEYEVGPFAIKGEAAYRHIDTENDQRLSTLYHVDVAGVRLGVIGNVQSKLSDSQLETIGVVDILVIPVGGGGYTLDATDASKIVRAIEPKIVIPIHYKENGVNYEVPQEELQVFINELGASVEETDKLKIKSAANIMSGLVICKLQRAK